MSDLDQEDVRVDLKAGMRWQDFLEGRMTDCWLQILSAVDLRLRAGGWNRQMLSCCWLQILRKSASACLIWFHDGL